MHPSDPEVMMRPELRDTDDRAVVTAAIAGDESAFTTLTRRHRRELHVHCYRMVASFEDAEDLVQETFLRAWQKRSTFEGRASFRSWLYRIATNACLDHIAKHRRVVSERELQTTESGLPLPPHVPWLEPYPDRLLDQIAPREGEPDATLVAKETIELAYLVALQFLPAKQRAVLILSDVLDWSARETASLLDDSVPAVNGALRRARASLRERFQPMPAVGRATSDPQERALLERYVEATQKGDVDGLARLLRDDVRSSMPPTPDVWAGRDAVVRSWVEGGFGQPPYDDFRCVIVRANRMPAVACYLRRPGDDAYRPLSLDVLRIEDGAIVEMTTFGLAEMLETFALPTTLH